MTRKELCDLATAAIIAYAIGASAVVVPAIILVLIMLSK